MIAVEPATTIGGVVTAFFTFAIAFLAYRSTKQKTDADSIRTQIADGQAAMKNSQAIYESASQFSERQNVKLRVDLDKAYELIDKLHNDVIKQANDMVKQDIECNRKLDKLAAEIRSLKAGRHE